MADTLKQFRGRVENIKDHVEKSAPNAALEGGKLIAARAKEILLTNGHYETGDLYRSIEANESNGVVTIGTPLKYGKKIEHLDDGGFLLRASEERTAQAIRTAGDSLDKAIKAGAK